jgi:LmbE family N-acetylglucosaminyl deacetylase
MKEISPKPAERWLDLLPGNPLGQANAASSVLIMTGTRDRFPEHPGEYDRVFLAMDEDWERWQRWYLQCFSRQLRPGGRLHLCQPAACRPSLASSSPRIRRKISRFRHNLAMRAPMLPLARILVSASLLSAAAAHGLALEPAYCRERAHPRALCFKKQDASPADENPVPAKQLAASFQQHFGAWFDAAEEPPSLSRAKLVEAASLIAGKPNATVLVLSPHPDDELIGCGGTLLLLAEAGAQIHVVQMTEGATCQALRNGSEAEKRSIRWEEAQSVSDSLGFHSHFWQTGPDYALAEDVETRQRLRQLLADLQPSLIFAPAGTDLHPEHRMACRLLRASREFIPSTATVLEYPVWGFLPETSHAVEVTHCYPRILRALYRYRTAMKAEDYVTRCRVLASHHAKRLLAKPGLAVEIFHASPTLNPSGKDPHHELSL